MTFFGYVAWLWRTRNCGHLRRRRIYGDDWMIYGPRYRCLDCGRTLSRDRQRAEARDCRKCGTALAACDVCGRPSQCGEVTCVDHTPDGADSDVRAEVRDKQED